MSDQIIKQRVTILPDVEKNTQVDNGEEGVLGLFVFSAFIHVEDQRRRRAAFEGGFFERGIVYEPKQTLMMAMTIVLIIAMMIVLMIIIVMMIDVKIMKNININQNKLPLHFVPFLKF